MLQGIKPWLLRQIRTRLGRDVAPFTPDFSGLARLLCCLRSQRINLVADIGANRGGYALDLFHYGYRGRVVSFEPIAALHDHLLRTSAGYPSWAIAPRCALGDAEGTAQLHVAANLSSSSILPWATGHGRDDATAAATRTVRVEETPVRRLDAALLPHLDDASVLFVKMDVQGFEDRVLAGATAILPRIRGLEIEMSTAPLYEGQTLFPNMLPELLAMGFGLWGLEPVLVDGDGRMLQFDAIFFR